MTCPSIEKWDLLAMEVLEETEAVSLLAHAKECADCRAVLESARRAHVDRVRMYEAFDRDHDALRDELMAALPDGPPPRVGWGVAGWQRLGDMLMSMNSDGGRRTLAVLAPAACILIAVTIFFWAGHQSAFAAALEQFRAAKTIVARITMPSVGMLDSDTEVESRMYVSSEYGTRVETNLNGELTQIQYSPISGPTRTVNIENGSCLELSPETLSGKKASARTPGAWLDHLKTLEAEAGVELGTKMIGEQKAIGYEIPGAKLGFTSANGDGQATASMELWVEKKSGRPVQIIKTVPMPDSRSPMVVVIDQFEWDVPLEASLFEPGPDIECVRFEDRVSAPSEETLLAALRKMSELSGGRYTSSLFTTTTLAEIRGLMTEEAKAEIREAGREGIMELGLAIGSGCEYYAQLARDGRNPEYFGESVTAEDVNEVLVRWELDDGQVRVIYGDLRVETLPASD